MNPQKPTSRDKKTDLVYKDLERGERFEQLCLLDSVGRLDGIDVNSLSEDELDALEREVCEYEVGRLKAWTKDSQGR